MSPPDLDMANPNTYYPGVTHPYHTVHVTALVTRMQPSRPGLRIDRIYQYETVKSVS